MQIKDKIGEFNAPGIEKSSPLKKSFFFFPRNDTVLNSFLHAPMNSK